MDDISRTLVIALLGLEPGGIEDKPSVTINITTNGSPIFQLDTTTRGIEKLRGVGFPVEES